MTQKYFPGQSRNRMESVQAAVNDNWEVVTVERPYPAMNSYTLKDWLNNMNLEQNRDYVYVDVVETKSGIPDARGIYVAMVAFRDSSIAMLFKLSMV